MCKPTGPNSKEGIYTIERETFEGENFNSRKGEIEGFRGESFQRFVAYEWGACVCIPE